MEEKGEAIKQIREAMVEVKPLPDEPDFHFRDDTIIRFLKAHEWSVKDAEKGLLETVEYRRMNAPLSIDCRWCHAKPGYHSMRQVGNDESGRPVVYANFAQATAEKNSLEDVVHHVTYLIENAKVTMGAGVSTWVFVIDCTGMTMSVCSPKVGLRVVNLLSAHYPERLGLIICVNHNPIFHAFWKAIKKFLAPSTASKMRLIRTEAKIRQTFSTFFPEDLALWMWDEITLNKTKPLIPSQRQFWSPVSELGEHDPRGCPSYLASHVNRFSPAFLEYRLGEEKMHCPHPNIAVVPGSRPDGALNPENNHLFDEKAASSQLVQDGGLLGEVDEITLSLTEVGRGSDCDDDSCDNEEDGDNDDDNRGEEKSLKNGITTKTS